MVDVFGRGIGAMSEGGGLRGVARVARGVAAALLELVHAEHLEPAKLR